MRAKKIIIAVVFVFVIVGGRCGFCTEITEWDVNSYSQQPDVNDLSQYYGFDEMEIVKIDWGIRGLTVADFSGDGRNDIAVFNNRDAKIELLIQKESIGPAEKEITVDPEDIDINAINPPSRFDRQSIAVSQKVTSLVCGDLNSDGLKDLAFYGEPKGLYVILQKKDEDAEAKQQGSGVKELSWHTRKKIRIDDGLLTFNSLACADLNNDGVDDLALAGRDVVYVILQKDDGSLAEPVKYPTSSTPLGVTTGDLNGDSLNDLVLVTDDGEKPIHVRFGMSTGELGPQVRFFIEKPYKLELADIDGKVGDEILVVDRRSLRLVCYKLSGQSEEDVDWPILLYPLTSGEGDTKRDLVTGDFDGDGLLDVVISEPGAAELIFYKQRSGLGLAEPVRFPAFSDIDCLSASEVVCEQGRKMVLGVLSTKEKLIGLSEFEDDRLSFPEPLDVAGEPVAMELADIDGDERTDCVYISKDVNDVRAFRVIYDLGAVIETGDIEQGEGSGKYLELDKLRSNPEGLRVVDVDQDGLCDVLVFVEYEEPILIRQVSARVFELIDSPKAQSSLIKEASLGSIDVADVDEQVGKELLIAQKNFARSLIFAEGESWSVIDQYNAKSTENKVSAVSAFDIEPADRPAIVLLDGQKGYLQVLKAGDDKTYRFEKELDVGQWDVAATHLKMLFEPLTGGEAKSVLLFDSKKFALITPPSAGNVPEHFEQQFNYATKIKDGMYGNLTAGDINSDGLVDIIMVEYKRNHIEILALDSDMQPVSALPWKIFEEKSYRGSKESKRSTVEPREMEVVDVTGDGRADLVTLIHDRIIIYPQD